jgi:hypothetical protein
MYVLLLLLLMLLVLMMSMQSPLAAGSCAPVCACCH